MCKNCYHARGRTKKASKCEHSDRPLYAKGICKNCYLSIYHKKKRSANKQDSLNPGQLVEEVDKIASSKKTYKKTQQQTAE